MKPHWKQAFTLFELLVIIALLALWVALLMPALAHTRPSSTAMRCMNNHWQLVAAWKMYAADYGGLLVNNASSGTHFTPAWANGWEDWNSGLSSGANTNTAYLSGALLGPYTTRNLSNYRCPADVIPSVVGPPL